MSEPDRHDRLVEDLVGDFKPVRRLHSPGRRAFGWCAAAVGLGLAVLPFVDTSALAARLSVLDLRLSALGSVLTALAAALAAFQTSVPGRPVAWALLPLPPLLLWLGASGLGCLRSWLAPASDVPDAEEMRGCFVFLVGVSLPLSALLVLMLRQAYSLQPNLTAALGGLAAAAGAGSLLVLFHPHDTTATDLVVHIAATLLVIGLNSLLGGRLLDGARSASRLRGSLHPDA